CNGAGARSTSGGCEERYGAPELAADLRPARTNVAAESLGSASVGAYAHTARPWPSALSVTSVQAAGASVPGMGPRRPGRHAGATARGTSSRATEMRASGTVSRPESAKGTGRAQALGSDQKNAPPGAAAASTG